MLHEGRRSVDLAIGIGDDYVHFTGGLRRYLERHADQALIVRLTNFDEIDITAFHEIFECAFMRAFGAIGEANDLSVGSYAERSRVAIRKVVASACAHLGERVFAVGQGGRRERRFALLRYERGAYFSWLIEDAIDLDLVAIVVGDGEGGVVQRA